MAAFIAKRMGEPDVEFRFKAGEVVSWPGSKSDEEHRGTVVDAVYPTRVGARRGRAVYLVHTATEDGDQWCVLVDLDDHIYPLCETPPPTIYYVPAPTPVYAYPYGYPHYRAAYRW